MNLVDEIVSNCSSVVTQTAEVCRGIAVSTLQDVHFDLNLIRKVSEAMSLNPNPFLGLQTKYLQDKYIEENTLYITPKENILGYGLCRINKNGNMILQEYPQTSIYVSILETLQGLLCNDEVAKVLLQKPINRRPGIYFDITDGTFFKTGQYQIQNHPYFIILIFQDAVEICNPLGNRSGKHKLVNFYWTMINIPPIFR